MASSRQGIFAQPVRPLDVGVGAALGLALGAVVKYLLNKLNATSGTIPAAILTYGGPIGTAIASIAIYLAERGSHPSRAGGHLVGGLLSAASPVYWKTLGAIGPKMADGTPFFSDYVMTSSYGLLTYGRSYGLLTTDRTVYSGAEDWDPMSAP